MTRGFTSWPRVPLKEILTHVCERVELDDMSEYITITVKRNHGGIEERERLLGHQIRTKKQFRVIQGAFIISRIQCWHEAYAFVPDEIPQNLIASTNYDQFEVAPEVDPQFFWWLSYLPLFAETVRSSAKGVVIEKMVFDRERWLEKAIPVPPLSEQKRIVERITAFMRKLEEMQKLRTEAIKIADHLTIAVRETPFHIRELRDQESRSEILGKLSYRITKGESPRWQGYSYVDEGPKFVRSENVLWGSLDLTNSKRIPRGFHEKLSRSKLKPRDVLVNLVGASIGRPAVVPEDIGDANINQAVAVISPKENLDPDYLMRFLLSPHAQFVLHSKKVDSARPNISLNDLKNLKIPLPYPDDLERSLLAQRSVVARLGSLQEKVDELRGLHSETEKKISELASSVLENAFQDKL
jgi:type I restriction enzyme S subunit